MNITKALNLYEVFQNHFNRSDWELYLRQLEKSFHPFPFMNTARECRQPYNTSRLMILKNLQTC